MTTRIDIEKLRKRIVILGGSYGGISTAHYVLQHAIPQLPQKETYEVVLVSTSSQAMCRPACPRALISDAFFPQEKLFVDIAKQFERYPTGSFRFIHGTATEFNHTLRFISVTSADGTEKLEFFALIIATGASTPSPLFGLHQGENVLRQSWETFRKALPTIQSIVIAGGGPTGVETAGELGEYLNGRPHWYSSKLTNPKVPITLVTSDSKLLPVLRASVAEKAEEFLAKVGVTVLKNRRVKGVLPEGAGSTDITSKATVTLDDGTAIETDLYIPATGARPNTSFISKELLTPDGRVDTNRLTLRVDRAGQRVYAIGDASSYARPAIHLHLAAVPILGANIKRDLLLAAGTEARAAGNDQEYKEDTRETQNIALGQHIGVGVFMGYRLPNFLVYRFKVRDYWLWTTVNLWNGKQWEKA